MLSENSEKNIAALSIHTLAAASKAAGDPLRLGILKLLGRGAFGVLELSQIFTTKQSGMSHHLKVLADAGLVSKQREGNSIFYRRPLTDSQDAFDQWLSNLFFSIDQSVSDFDIGDQVSEVMAERSRDSEEFFAKHAEDFREQQDLIASYEDYASALKDILKSVPLQGKALEIGPGEGAFLIELSGLFEQVTGVDISPEMLAKAKQTVNGSSVSNVNCLLGDTSALTQNGQCFDFAVANMVLHHVPSPQEIFKDAALLLKPTGKLLITDLCHHEQDWVRESCGDLWLGFAPEDLSQWANSAGLVEDQSQFSGLRNGFQIQYRLFTKPE